MLDANGSWTGLLAYLHNGTVDTLAADFQPTTDRLRSFRFSSPYVITSDAIAISSLFDTLNNK